MPLLLDTSPSLVGIRDEGLVNEKLVTMSAEDVVGVGLVPALAIMLEIDPEPVK